jgi:hypothetical protein
MCVCKGNIADLWSQSPSLSEPTTGEHVFEIYLHSATGDDSPVGTLQRRCVGCWTDHHPAHPVQWTLVGHKFIILWTAGISKFSIQI